MTSMSEISENVDHFMLYCSLDSWGEQAEYIRNGMNFTTLLNNVEDFLRTCNRHSSQHLLLLLMCSKVIAVYLITLKIY